MDICCACLKENSESTLVGLLSNIYSFLVFGQKYLENGINSFV